MNRLLCVFSLILSLTVCAQDKVSVVVDLDDVEVAKKVHLPFSTIQVIDVRFDKSNIGSLDEKVKVDKQKLHKTIAVFPDSLHKYLPVVFNNLLNIDKESKDTLLLLVKQFRLVDHMLDGVQRQYEPKLLAKISVSFFKLNNNQLTRIFSVDDLAFKKWNNEKHLNKDLLPEFRKEALASILQSLFINRNWQAEGASFPLQAVKESIEKRFQLPLYNESSLVAGIYNSFKEFKNNQPSITNVLFKKKGNKIEILDASGKQLEPEKYWGICYERKRYIIFRGELCELLPSDKSFRFLSYSQTSDLAGRASYGEYAQQTGLYPAMMIKNSHKEVSRHYFYLNMDEEEIYLEEVFGKSTLKRLQKDLLK